MVHICPTCSNSYTQSGSLNRHMSVVHGSKAYECDVCHRNLSTKSSLDRHKRLKHGSDNKIKKEGIYEMFSDGGREIENNNNIDNNKNVYTNNAGRVETDNKEELDNSGSEASTTETDNKKDIDNNESDSMDMDNNSIGSEESVMEGKRCTKELDFKHNLFDVIETCK